jgi:hypothetical protein
MLSSHTGGGCVFRFVQARRGADERPSLSVAQEALSVTQWAPCAVGHRAPLAGVVGNPQRHRCIATASPPLHQAPADSSFSFSASGWLIGYHFGVIAGLEVRGPEYPAGVGALEARTIGQRRATRTHKSKLQEQHLLLHES